MIGVSPVLTCMVLTRVSPVEAGRVIRTTEVSPVMTQVRKDERLDPLERCYRGPRCMLWRQFLVMYRFVEMSTSQWPRVQCSGSSGDRAKRIPSLLRGSVEIL